jgi:hypothetical protein
MATGPIIDRAELLHAVSNRGVDLLLIRHVADAVFTFRLRVRNEHLALSLFESLCRTRGDIDTRSPCSRKRSSGRLPDTSRCADRKITLPNALPFRAVAGSIAGYSA